MWLKEMERERPRPPFLRDGCGRPHRYAPRSGSGSPSAGHRVGVLRGTLRAGGAVEAGRRPRPRVPRTAPGRRGSGAPPGRDAGPTPTAAVARSKARRKSGAARRRRGLATAARGASRPRAPARCRFVGGPGARAEDLSSNTKRGTYLRVTHNNSDRGGVPPGRHPGSGHPLCLILAP